MEKVILRVDQRDVFGKKVKNLRKKGLIPAHIFGKKVETLHIVVKEQDFNKVFTEVGETGLINLKVSDEKVRPVLIRDVQYHPLTEKPLHIDFYQVNLTEKVKVVVPVVLTGEEPELVHSGEAVVIQPLNEIEVEALPGDLPEKIEADVSLLKEINDTVFVSNLQIPAGVEVLVDPEAVVIKLDKAVTAQMEQLLAEQEAEASAVQTETEEGAKAEEGEEKETEGEVSAEGEEKTEEQSEEKQAE